MVIFRKAADAERYLQDSPKPIGYIPTMGALHAGHTSLIGRAREDGLLTVCSIFVNPTQFNDREDYERYPISTDADIALLIEAGCDVLFLPSEAEVYPHGSVMTTAYAFGELESVLEGAQRPGHFRGVGQVVGRLLEIIQPRYLYLGQKDYQQCMIINKLISMMGKAGEVELVMCPTVREPDGLAMSSRNRRLTEPQRTLSSVIYQCLVSIQVKAGSSPFAIVRKECMDLLAEKGFETEYVALADAETLELMDEYDPGRGMVALIAARLGKVRLIDNMLIGDRKAATTEFIAHSDAL
jgi:pantoate--beta-alanine ligase